MSKIMPEGGKGVSRALCPSWCLVGTAAVHRHGEVGTVAVPWRGAGEAIAIAPLWLHTGDTPAPEVEYVQVVPWGGYITLLDVEAAEELLSAVLYARSWVATMPRRSWRHDRSCPERCCLRGTGRHRVCVRPVYTAAGEDQAEVSVWVEYPRGRAALVGVEISGRVWSLAAVESGRLTRVLWDALAEIGVQR